jgi:hypothetical protein
VGRFGRPADSRQRCGLSRTALYEMASIDPAIFRKNGNATIVDYQRVDRNLSKLPLAEIKQTKDT